MHVTSVELYTMLLYQLGAYCRKVQLAFVGGPPACGMMIVLKHCEQLNN